MCSESIEPTSARPSTRAGSRWATTDPGRGRQLPEREAALLPARGVRAGVEPGDGPAEPAGRSAGVGRARRGADPVGRVPPRGAGRATRSCPGFAIAARGAVRSVKLFSRVPFGRIDRLALDDGLADEPGAGAGLARRRPRRPARDGSSRCRWACRSQESTADAVLLIGDRAMKVPDAPFHAVVDLAEAWNDADRPAVRLRPLGGPAGRRPGRPARGPGPVPGRGAGARRRAGGRARAEARPRRRDLLTIT